MVDLREVDSKDEWYRWEEIDNIDRAEITQYALGHETKTWFVR